MWNIKLQLSNRQFHSYNNFDGKYCIIPYESYGISESEFWKQFWILLVILKFLRSKLSIDQLKNVLPRSKLGHQLTKVVRDLQPAWQNVAQICTWDWVQFTDGQMTQNLQSEKLFHSEVVLYAVFFRVNNRFMVCHYSLLFVTKSQIRLFF